MALVQSQQFTGNGLGSALRPLLRLGKEAEFAGLAELDGAGESFEIARTSNQHGGFIANFCFGSGWVAAG
jgi:hypothetical protein